MAPATLVFAGEPAPTGVRADGGILRQACDRKATSLPQDIRCRCRNNCLALNSKGLRGRVKERVYPRARAKSVLSSAPHSSIAQLLNLLFLLVFITLLQCNTYKQSVKLGEHRHVDCHAHIQEEQHDPRYCLFAIWLLPPCANADGCYWI